MSDLMDRIIADLVEGARRSEGFIRGSRANVEVARENRGREEKLAAFNGEPLGVRAVKAAIFGTPGQPMMDPSVTAARLVHGTEPAIKKPMTAKPPPIPAAAMRKAAEDGALAALRTFGIKEAFIPALIAGARALAPMAGKALGFLGKNPIGQQVAGTAASMGVQRAMTPSQPQQPGM